MFEQPPFEEPALVVGDDVESLAETSESTNWVLQVCAAAWRENQSAYQPRPSRGGMYACRCRAVERSP
jgi:hypothetical protein